MNKEGLNATKGLISPKLHKELTKIVNSKDLGECWSAIRLVRSDCTKCARHSKCHFSVKGEYPNAQPDYLYAAQLELLALKQAIKKLIKEYEK